MGRAACPESREPRRRSPDKVNWPPQFVSSNGTGELLPAGALEPDEAPFGSATCRLCNEGNLGRAPAGTAAPHVLERRHKERCERAREYYLAFWQELACPDERPYYYDHVSHTWTFARPPCLTVLAGVSPEADLEPGGPDDEEPYQLPQGWTLRQMWRAQKLKGVPTGITHEHTQGTGRERISWPLTLHFTVRSCRVGQGRSSKSEDRMERSLGGNGSQQMAGKRSKLGHWLSSTRSGRRIPPQQKHRRKKKKKKKKKSTLRWYHR